MDLHPGQGRDERGRNRSVLQSPQLRSDVRLPRAVASRRHGGGRGGARVAHPQAGGGPAVQTAGSVSWSRGGAVMSRRHRERLAEDEGHRSWKGGYRSYDIVKEASIALGAVVAICLLLTILFSSPDEKPSTVRSWARTDPVDFVTTAVS